MENQLYIGLNGYAGAGKDTVAKILKVMLSQPWASFEQFMDCFKHIPYSSDKFATFSERNNIESQKVHCIAFADPLKYICSDMFGVPVDRFYYDKANAWICVNDDFSYTEIRPASESIITAQDYYCGGYKNDQGKKWYMSLREILVYVGTYVLQRSINRNIFVNVVNNTIKQQVYANPTLSYVIVTDVRFLHELDYIRGKHGININIVRNGLEQLKNVAEHDLDDCEVFDYVIENDGSYEDLCRAVWDLVHEEEVFKNKTIQLQTRDGYISNYLRKIGEDTYMVCPELSVSHISHSGGSIVAVDLQGGPKIELGVHIPNDSVGTLIPEQIWVNGPTRSNIYIKTSPARISLS